MKGKESKNKPEQFLFSSVFDRLGCENSEASLDSSRESLYKVLEAHFTKWCYGQKPHMFLHRDEYVTSEVSPGIHKYTKDELEALKKRDFETHLLITAFTCIEITN